MVYSLEQVRAPDPRYQIGRGKAEELAELVKDVDAEKIIFDNTVKPVQAYNLAKLTGVEVIDRFQLILEIFARRASSSEAKLQIQLAQLQYELPQAKEKVRLARMGEQPGFMGLGMYEVDLYYDSIRRQIAHIRDKLKSMGEKRSLHRVHRLELGFSLVSLAGYTNSGKSTLFNSLTEEAVPVDSGLFTTLSTTTRVLELPRKRVLLTDTVGFIDRLPLTLIEAFHSTLEETIFSDLIVLLVDISEPQKEIERKLSCCLDTIQRIGVEGVPMVTALNKIDLISEEERRQKVEALKDTAPNPVAISALRKTNLTQLEEEIIRNLKNYVQASFSLPITGEAMVFISWLSNRADINSIKYKGNTVNVHFGAIPWFADKVKGRVEQLGGSFSK